MTQNKHKGKVDRGVSRWGGAVCVQFASCPAAAGSWLSPPESRGGEPTDGWMGPAGPSWWNSTQRRRSWAHWWSITERRKSLPHPGSRRVRLGLQCVGTAWRKLGGAGKLMGSGRARSREGKANCIQKGSDSVHGAANRRPVAVGRFARLLQKCWKAQCVRVCKASPCCKAFPSRV